MWKIIVIVFAMLLLLAAVLSLANLFLDKLTQNKRLRLRLENTNAKRARNKEIRKEIHKIAKKRLRRLRAWLKIRKREQKPLLYKTAHRKVVDDSKS